MKHQNNKRVLIAALVALANNPSAYAIELVENGFLPTDKGGDTTAQLQLDSPSCECAIGDGTFCGTDGQCHYYNCEAFYEFGHTNYTGYGTDAPELSCEDIPETEVTWGGDTSSVNYRCVDLDPKPVGMGWTKYCEASTSNSNFTCYELADGTNFDNFLARVESSDLECNSEKYNETDPFYLYTAATSNTIWKDGGRFGNSNFHTSFNVTQEFNSTKALAGTMSSSFKLWTDAPTPTPSPAPSAYPINGGDSATSKGAAGIVMIVGLLGAFF